MKIWLLTLVALVTLTGATARMQETKGHDHAQMPADAAKTEKAEAKADKKGMCACCKDMDSEMKSRMQEQMKGMKEMMKDKSAETGK